MLRRMFRCLLRHLSVQNQCGLLGPLENLRELNLSVSVFLGSGDLGFLSHVYSFAFREKLETFSIIGGKVCCSWWCDSSFLPQEELENLSCFPNLKSLTLDPPKRVQLIKDGMEKIAEGCKKLQRISLGPCEKLTTDESLGILAAKCPDLRVLKIVGCSHVTEEGIEACKIPNPNLEVYMTEGIELPEICDVHNLWRFV